MASSCSSIFLMATIMLAFVSHTQAAAGSVAQAKAVAQSAISAIQGATNLAKKYKQTLSCVETFNDALDEMKDCLSALNSWSARRKADVQTWGSAAMTDVNQCGDDLGSTVPADLHQAAAKANGILSSFLKIVNGL